MSNYSNIVKNKVLSALNEYSMLQNVKNVVVGFSGGADSVCLLSVLNSLSYELGITVKAIHINHNIRGVEAKRDEMFAVEFCKKNGIDIINKSFNCIKEAKLSKESLEACGRRRRYDFFYEASHTAFTKIATAHNADDNAETVIFNLSRGASYKGACGIPPVRDNIIRPLIFCTREEIEGYCGEKGLEYVTDSTNLCDDYTRNKIRHNVIPVTKEINSSSVENFTRFSQSVRDVADYISKQAEEFLEIAYISDNLYDANKLKNLHNAVLSEAIVIAFERFSEKSISNDKLSLIKSLIFSGGRVQLFGNERVEVIKNKLRFYNELNHDPPDTQNVSIGNSNTFGEYTVKVSKFTDCSKNISKNILDNLIDCDKIVGTLFLRCRKEGDKFSLFNRRVTKTLKNLFNEFSVPIEKRESIPILCDNNGIVWIYGIGVNSRCHITDETKSILYIEGEINE